MPDFPEHSTELPAENFPGLKQIKDLVLKLNGSDSNLKVEDIQTDINHLITKVSIIVGNEASGKFVRYVYEKTDPDILKANSKLPLCSIHKWEYDAGVASGSQIAEYANNTWLRSGTNQPL